MTSEKGCRKEKNQNIQVFVRLRPLNQRERDLKSLGVVEVHNNKEVVVRISQQNSITKKFTFDRAFAPYANQVEVYQEVVSPLIEEVLAGYNCTVFAYGQTGTGKTHTMVGENTGDETTWQKDPLAGIIPRALSQLFDELRISNTEYTVRVSYLELYNEELFDLLATSEDNSKLRIYEDVTRKGSNIVNGLEEITVYNKKEVFRIMAQGQERKKVASTLMNAQSSRSHTVFTIVVHMKENSPEGEELVKIGKLNLVDLAGSENISKAGSDNPAKRERARECVNINQSLLTLGRVITALVERHPHVPYRESKLTRILQESLGGRTKTSIIATISPGHKDLEETMSTLEYAHRAKNIQNKPEINQKMTKKAILKEYAEEIDRLKRDLQAARDKNGVYLANETFAEITLKQEEQRKEIQELLLKKRAMEEERDKMENVFSNLSRQLECRDAELNETKNKLNKTNARLADTCNVLKTTKQQFEEQQYLVLKHRDTEQTLTQQANQLLATVDVATTHVACLHDSVEKRRQLENVNLEVTKTYVEQSSQHREHLTAGIGHYVENITAALKSLDDAMNDYTDNSTRTQEESKLKLEELIGMMETTINEIRSLASDTQTSLVTTTEQHRNEARSMVSDHKMAICAVGDSLVESANDTLVAATNVDLKGHIARFVEQWYRGAAERVTSLQRAHAAFDTRGRDARLARGVLHAARRDGAREQAARARLAVQACLQEFQQEKSYIEQRLEKQLTEIQKEREETDLRLSAWMDEERRLLEERLARHVESEKKALECKLEVKMQEVKGEKALLEERMSRYIELQNAQLQVTSEALEQAEEHASCCENQIAEDENSFKSYGKEFEEGVSAVGTEMEAFSKNVVEVVEHINNELVAAVQRAATRVQQDVKKVMTIDDETCKRFTDQTNSVLDHLLAENARTVDSVTQNIQSNTTTTIENIRHLASTLDFLVSLSRSLRADHSARVQDMEQEAFSLEGQVRDAVERHEDLERQCLAQSYRVYSPTGRTPARCQYRYPRALAATSPHARLLQRLRDNSGHARASPDYSGHDDCVVVEDVDEAELTDFTPPAKHNLNILKSTSETDIYHMRKLEHQGKENCERGPVSSMKKPSRLPAPAARPLAERNGLAH